MLHATASEFRAAGYEVYLEASWERLVEALSVLTLNLGSPKQRSVLMVLEPADATQLANTYDVWVGLAETVEAAVVVALIVSPEKVRCVGRHLTRHVAA